MDIRYFRFFFFLNTSYKTYEWKTHNLMGYWVFFFHFWKLVEKVPLNEVIFWVPSLDTLQIYSVYLHFGILWESEKTQIGISFTVMIAIESGTQIVATASFRHSEGVSGLFLTETFASPTVTVNTSKMIICWTCCFTGLALKLYLGKSTSSLCSQNSQGKIITEKVITS